MIINSRDKDHFFTNREYLSIYKEYHHEFQTDAGEILTANGYGDVMLRLVYLDGSEITWTIIKVSWALSLRRTLLSTIFLARKRVEVFF